MEAFCRREQFPEQRPDHQSHDGDDHLFGDLPERTADAQPRQAQAEEHREHAEQHFEECLRLRRQRRRSHQTDDTTNDDAESIEDGAEGCFDHPQTETFQRGSEKRKVRLIVFVNKKILLFLNTPRKNTS
ncbi:MAG: hypothetical protein QM813_07120 [Verrucomicrobiota bacterium]